ncbi:ABC transporter permease [bacterium]|nr:ABC transporter permease [bacterium]
MKAPIHRNLLTGLGFLMKRALVPRGTRLMGMALWMSVGGVALGVAMLILVLSVMSGFLDFLQTKYTDITSPIVVIPRESGTGAAIRNSLPLVAGVKAITPFALNQSMVIKDGVGGVTLEGISFKESLAVTPWEKIWWEAPEPLQAGVGNWIWLGKGLADKLKIKRGDTVRLMIGKDNLQTVPFVVTAITKFGIYDHDLRYAYIDLEKMQKLFFGKRIEPFYKVALQDGYSLEQVAEQLRAELGETAAIKKWSDINQNIFLAVRHQKMMLFWVLDIVVALAGMNVVNLLMMSTYQRKRDVAILKAMGMRFQSVVLFFVGQGAIVGAIGIGLGIAMGVVLCEVVEKFQPALLSEQIYNVSKLPLKLEWADVGSVCLIAMLLCVVFSVLPALKAATSAPVQALRYE